MLATGVVGRARFRGRRIKDSKQALKRVIFRGRHIERKQVSKAGIYIKRSKLGRRAYERKQVSKAGI